MSHEGHTEFMEQLLADCLSHDLYHEYSDDHRVWLSGSCERQSLVSRLSRLHEQDAEAVLAGLPTERAAIIRSYLRTPPAIALVEQEVTKVRRESQAGEWLRNLPLKMCSGCGRETLFDKCAACAAQER